VLALKKNHGDLYDDVATFFKEERKTAFKNTVVHQHQTVEKDHGRLETRTIAVSSTIDWL
jgi:predicted transposase YbfD/YdcC